MSDCICAPPCGDHAERAGRREEVGLEEAGREAADFSIFLPTFSFATTDKQNLNIKAFYIEGLKVSSWSR